MKNNRDLHITKADKSNALVILNKQDYNDKIYAMLDDSNTYGKLTSNPYERVLSNFNKKIKNVLSGNNELVKRFLQYLHPYLIYMGW